MKPFKQQLKEEGKIFIHNFVSIICILVGYHMVSGAPNFLGILLGAIIFAFGMNMLFTAFKKGIEVFIEQNFPQNKKNQD